MNQKIIEQILIPEPIELELQSIANASDIEECALFFGKDEGFRLIVEKFVQLYNIDQSPVSFEFDQTEYLKVMQENSLDIVGVWHSHPQGMPYPSSKDFEFMNHFQFVWTIYSKKQSVSQSFMRIPDSEFPIRIKETMSFDIWKT